MTRDQVANLLAAWGIGVMCGALGLWATWRWFIGKDWWRP